MVTFELFARPVIEALAGMTPRKLVFLNARLKSEIKTKTGLKRFLPAIFPENSRMRKWNWRDGTDQATLRPWPGQLLYRDSAGSRANCSRGMGAGADDVR